MPDPKRSDRLERLTNLVLVLIETGRPLSLREIASRVAGYPEGGEAARQAFERDKRALRDLNIPLSLETISGNEQVGYRIKPEEYYLPGLGIDEGEAQALAFAVASVRLGSAAGWSAIAKLGGPVSEAALERAGLGPSGGPHLGPVAVLPSLPLLGELHEAIRRRSVVAFSYRDRPRRVEPYVLHFRAGAWYLVGLELSAAGGPSVRTFRVDRMGDGISLSERDAFVAPEPSAIEEIRLMPWSAPRDAEALPIAELVIDARLSRSVAAQLPSGAQASFDEEGALRLSMPVSDEAAFVSFVAGLGDTAVLEGPQELRASLVAHLRLLAEPSPQERPGRDELEPAALPGRARRDAATEPGASQAHGLEGSGRHKRENARAAPSGLVAGERLRRLLAILVHLARVGDESLDELGERFSMSEDELVHELELAACCGVPPYSPDSLIDLFVDGDRVVADGLRELARPGRLTAEEAFVLAAAARGLLAVPGAADEAALSSALSKLESALGSSPMSLDIAEPEHLEVLRSAAERSERVELVYFSSAAAAPSTRVVEPYQVVLREGRWYLDGLCEPPSELRRLQVDRVRQVRVLGEHFEVPEELSAELARRSGEPGAFLGGPDAITATIAVPPGSELIMEQIASGPFEALKDGRIAVPVLVGDPVGWLGRLLLRLGPNAEVLEPSSLRGAQARAAERALGRYVETGRT